MQIPEKYIKLKNSLLKEVSKLRQQQRLLTIKKIASLPFINKLPEIRELMERLNSEKVKKERVEENPKIKGLSMNRISQCILPPYTAGYSAVIDEHEAHPVSVLYPDELIPYLFNPFASVNHFTGEISLAAISGQIYYDFYAGKPFEFINGILGTFVQICGTISQKIELPVAYDYDTLVEINVKVDMPANYTDVVKLSPGGLSTNLFGMVGAEGFIDIYTGPLIYDSYLINSSSNNFLNAWETADTSEIIAYQNNPVCTHSFMLPAGSTEFWINVSAHIDAHSAVPTTPPLYASPELDYALIDFRSSQLVDDQISRNNGFEDDHHAPGAITIKEICISYEPYYIKLPDTR